MSSEADLAISVERLGKRYRLGRHGDPYGRLTESLWRGIRAPLDAFRRQEPEASEWVWALHDVSFDIRQGETVGFIGHNGAGKTTLLKVLSRITEPTTGSVELRGRVSSLLEVGTGFHPELTGRENVYLSSAVFGMRRAEIDRKFDEIVDFAGVEVAEYLDTPVKRYSSGMQVRLGFAVAAHLEPDILIVDEVLAVGDAAFQQKCLGKLDDAASQGRTVLLVSHNMAAVQSLCKRAVWLDHGGVVSDGDAGRIVPAYLATSVPVAVERTWQDPASAPGNSNVRLLAISARPESREPESVITANSPVLLETVYENMHPNARLKVIMEIYNRNRTLIIHTASEHESDLRGAPMPRGTYRSVCRIPGKLLNTGRHSVNVRIVRDEHHTDVSLEDAVVFDIVESNATEAYHDWLGAVRPELEWRTDQVMVNEV